MRAHVMIATVMIGSKSTEHRLCDTSDAAEGRGGENEGVHWCAVGSFGRKRALLSSVRKNCTSLA